jgi:hypothetical protein
MKRSLYLPTWVFFSFCLTASVFAQDKQPKAEAHESYSSLTEAWEKTFEFKDADYSAIFISLQKIGDAYFMGQYEEADDALKEKLKIVREAGLKKLEELGNLSIPYILLDQINNAEIRGRANKDFKKLGWNSPIILMRATEGRDQAIRAALFRLGRRNVIESVEKLSKMIGKADELSELKFAIDDLLKELRTSKWAGIEVVGYKTHKREDFLKELPFEVGDEYKEDREGWEKWCENLKAQYDLAYTNCSSVRYADFRAYFVISIVEKGDEDRIKFRAIANEESEFITADTRAKYDALYKRLWKLFDEGRPPIENSKSGFLDYDDLEMHNLCLELSKVVPSQREKIIRALKNHKDSETRAMAANLLNWAGSHELTIPEVIVLLDDPAMNVRNNISRYVSPFVDQVKDGAALRQIVDQLKLQLQRPSHADRNKAIYSLLHVAQNKPDLRAYILETARPQIEQIQSQSILENVKGPAQELLTLLKRPA